jgi:Tfp pilus assembly protein PilX
MVLGNSRGSALILSILILLVLTAVGIFAVNTSTMETRIAGNERQVGNAFYAADGGVDYGLQILEWVLSNPSATALPSGATASDLDQLRAEILGNDTSNDPSVTTTIGDFNMTINVDRLSTQQMTGFSLEFGTTEDQSRSEVLYRIDANASGPANSRVLTTYRRVVNN